MSEENAFAALKDTLLRKQVHVALSSLNISIREMAQVNRSIVLASLAIIQEDKAGALAQMEEAGKYLTSSMEYLSKMMQISEEISAG